MNLKELIIIMILNVFLIIEQVLVAAFAFLLIMKYSHVNSSFIVKFMAFLGWLIGFGMIALLPLDIIFVRLENNDF